MAGLRFNPNAGSVPHHPPAHAPHAPVQAHQQNLAQAGLKNHLQTGKNPQRAPNEPGALPRKSETKGGKAQLSGELSATLQNLTISRRGGKGNGAGGTGTGGGGFSGGTSGSVSRTRTTGTQSQGPVRYRAVATPSTMAQRRIQHTSHDVAMPPAQPGAGKAAKAGQSRTGGPDFAEHWMPPSGAMSPKSRLASRFSPFSALKSGLAMRGAHAGRFAGRAMSACGDFFSRLLSPTPEQKQIHRNQEKKLDLRRSVEERAVREQGLERNIEKRALERQHDTGIHADVRRAHEAEGRGPRPTEAHRQRDVHPQFAEHAHTTPGHSFVPGTMPHQAIVQAT